MPLCFGEAQGYHISAAAASCGRKMVCISKSNLGTFLAFLHVMSLVICPVADTNLHKGAFHKYGVNLARARGNLAGDQETSINDVTFLGRQVGKATQDEIGTQQVGRLARMGRPIFFSTREKLKSQKILKNYQQILKKE